MYDRANEQNGFGLSVHYWWSVSNKEVCYIFENLEDNYIVFPVHSWFY